ncbi:hypothetical protein EN759_00455 [Mesorhizobium sp. M00.F.Ca.ET.038.03.1.1]|nr:hypothetical protein EN759_00455 [Mesorhizobium sp. M00.F.Ca.ET.038.03.1.1]TIW04534.1 MAG: hypothetical protein E5V77_00175 [Mesorhizobium sp.]
MKITLKDGSTIELPFSAGNCTGYVATSIALDAADVRRMRSLFEGNPSEFRVAMAQLEARFPENRVGGR